MFPRSKVAANVERITMFPDLQNLLSPFEELTPGVEISAASIV